MTKDQIRKEIKEKIAALSESELKAQSEALCSKIIESKLYTSCTALLAYMPLKDEADVTPVIQDALSKGKKVFLPRVFPETNQMEFYRYDTRTKTAPGSFGITEPARDEAQSFAAFLSNSKATPKTLVLVPGRAFTLSGKRLGRGKGFYDIYFSQLADTLSLTSPSDIKKSGVCFACQILEDLPTTPDDILMDNIFSGKSDYCYF
jgi:5-formyltetrahydrofolate cyclo-ligase